uniref:UTP--glucose-1-phosphate uridylyltransferase n=1 Tax=Candidatus Kentrum sp. FM TaxID=2126340 RepID=A0A450TJW3_9GAMM|nr:MAG: UTP--glucose-1-phosphate uridylyltransferase [Candidatus Kentron sp. FM]VFJ67759.1 MAG: UTP--glucose-1-phosphate uridylyltransferase [Candidatus Kentron sp. FM]VFK13634.1 MAG: UTP--glucose-1-phosphate uridylyltransferase [Candidatus Kentron sp. FM]
MNATIKKAVFPVAGLGTRFLPVTKANPKEMLPIVDKPLIQYAVEEAVAAGIRELVFITGRGKRAIEDHFDNTCELEMSLMANGEYRMLTHVRGILPEEVSCLYIRQPKPLGLGEAVLRARPAIGDEPFAVILADDLIDSGPGCMAQMVAAYRRYGSALLAVESIPAADTGKYGIIRAHGFVPDHGPIPNEIHRIHRVGAIVEKPAPDKAPSTLGVVGRYILPPAIFDQLVDLGKDDNGEIQLTDGIARLLAHEQVLALEFTGKRYDCGDKLGFLRATVEYALKHPELKHGFSSYLTNLRTAIDGAAD